MAGKSEKMRRWLMGLAFIAVPQLAFAEIIAGDPCSPAEQNQFRRTGGPETSGTAYTLICNGSTWTRVLEFDANANVGVKQASPKAPLHIGGEVIVGETTGLNCDADRKGGLRWNSASSGMQVCNGSVWQGMAETSMAAGPDRAIQFNNSSALAGTSSFVYTSAGRVGIGTANPAASLEVVGDIRATHLETISLTGNYPSSSDDVLTLGTINLIPTGGQGFREAVVHVTATYFSTNGHHAAAYFVFARPYDNKTAIIPPLSWETYGAAWPGPQLEIVSSAGAITFRVRLNGGTIGSLPKGRFLISVEGGQIENFVSDMTTSTVAQPSVMWGGALSQYGNQHGNTAGIGYFTTGNKPQAMLHIRGRDAALSRSLIVDGDGEAEDMPFAVRTKTSFSGGNYPTDADTKFVIRGTGEVGIGTLNPASTGAQVLKLDVEGPVGATHYCDSDGNNCFNPSSGMNAVAAGPDGAIQFNSSSALGGASNFVYNAASGFIGHGTAIPQAPFHIITPQSAGIIVEGAGGGESSIVFDSATSGSAQYGLRIGVPANTQNLAIRAVSSDGTGTLSANTPFVFKYETAIVSVGSHGAFGWGRTLHAGNPNYLLLAREADGVLKIVAGSSVSANYGSLRAASAGLMNNMPGSVPLTLAGAVSQTANLTEWQDSSGAVLAHVNKEGKLGAPAYCDVNGGNCFNPASGMNAAAAGPEGAIQFNSSSALVGVGAFVYSSQGRVGIGTANPSSLLEVDGITTLHTIHMASPSARISRNGNDITFWTGSTERIRLDALGNFNLNSGGFYHRRSSKSIGIGTTLPAATLHVNAASAGAQGLIVQGAASQTANLTEWQSENGTALAVFSSAGHLAIGKSTPQTALDVVGDIQYTGEIQDVSDRRLKENIVPLADQLVKITALQPVSFVMKGDSKTELGLIAQDVEPLFPDLVRTASDEIGTKSINYIGLIAPLIRAVQEQQAEINSQQQTIQRLENQIDTLETRLFRLEKQEGISSP